MKSIKNLLGRILFKIKIILIGLYNSLPLTPPQKLRLKNIIFPYTGFLFKNSLRYRYWKISGCDDDSAFRISGPDLFYASEQPGRIGVHLHLYYIDLLDEFAGYLSRMPYDYDLFVSVTDKKNEEKVLKKFGCLEKINDIKVVTVENRGRDVAPMVVTFAKDLLSYDYVCHIHTKKSTHAGFEQRNWRDHLLYNLFGSKDVVRKIFAVFDAHSDVGIIYPETYHNIPYWTQTWLSNRDIAAKLLTKLKIDPVLPDYVDYPAGTMFWARIEAVEPLLALGLKYEDFAEEKGQMDGTIAHAIEHSLVLIARKSGMHLCEVNFETDIYRLYLGSRNLWQYWVKSRNNLIDVVIKADFVSFDILDTLIVRPFFCNQDIFKIIEIRIRKELGLDIDFVRIRKESGAGIEKSGGCNSIDEIYDSFRSITGLDQVKVTQIKEMELRESERLCSPRHDISYVFNYAKTKKKKIIIINDLGLNESEAKKILVKNGFQGNYNILSTSGLNMGKDTGEIWDYYEDHFKNQRGIHIGHDEHADIQMLSDRNIPFYHVMSSRNIFLNTHFGHLFHGKFHGKLRAVDSLVIGTIISRIFGSPFCLSETNGSFRIKDPKTLGYMVFGPLALGFSIWIANNIHGHRNQRSFCFENERCFASKLLDEVLKKSKVRDCCADLKADEDDFQVFVSIDGFPGSCLINEGSDLPRSHGYKCLFFFKPEIRDFPSSLFCFRNRPRNRFVNALLSVLSSEYPSNEFSMEKENADAMFFSAFDGILDFFNDILEVHGDLIVEENISEEMADFFFEVLDSDLVCI